MGRIEFPVLVKRIGIGNGGGAGVLILIGSIPDPAGISVPMPNQANTKLEGTTWGEAMVNPAGRERRTN